MRNVSGQFRHVCQLAAMLLRLVIDAVRYLGLCLRPSPSLAAEILFLRNNWRCIKSAKLGRGGRQTPSALFGGSASGLIGDPF